MDERMEQTPFECGRLAFMEGQTLHLGLDTNAEFAAGWLDAFEEFAVAPWRERHMACG